MALDLSNKFQMDVVAVAQRGGIAGRVAPGKEDVYLHVFSPDDAVGQWYGYSKHADGSPEALIPVEDPTVGLRPGQQYRSLGSGRVDPTNVADYVANPTHHPLGYAAQKHSRIITTDHIIKAHEADARLVPAGIVGQPLASANASAKVEEQVVLGGMMTRAREGVGNMARRINRGDDTAVYSAEELEAAKKAELLKHDGALTTTVGELPKIVNTGIAMAGFGLVTTLGSVLTRAVAPFLGKGEATANKAANFMDTFVKSALPLMFGLVLGMSALKIASRSGIGEVAESAQDATRRFENTARVALMDAGTNIGNLANGVREGAGTLFGAAKGIADGAIKGVANMFNRGNAEKAVVEQAAATVQHTTLAPNPAT